MFLDLLQLGGEIKIRLWLGHSTVLFNPQSCPCRQGTNSLVERPRFRNMTPDKETDVARRVRRGIDVTCREQGLNLGCGTKACAVIDVIQRLDAERIAGKENPARPRVPQRERKHPTKLSHHSSSAFLIKVQQDLGITLRAESVTFPLKLCAQLPKVVNLAVEYDSGAAIRRRHRL